jgi:hypothetical protein
VPEDLCNTLKQIIEVEFNSPDFTTNPNSSKEFDKARYLYVYLCHVVLNIPFVEIRKTMTCYQYPKTIYQVFRRSYIRRKEPEFLSSCKWVLMQLKNRKTIEN